MRPASPRGGLCRSYLHRSELSAPARLGAKALTLLSTASVAALSIASFPARAANECGPVGTGIVVCDTSTYAPASGDIVYNPTNAGPFSLTATGITVGAPPGLAAGQHAISIVSTGTAPSGRPISFNGTGLMLSPNGSAGYGLNVQSGSAGGANPGAAINVIFRGMITGNSTGIHAQTWGVGATSGRVSVIFDGTINQTAATGRSGINAWAPMGGSIYVSTAAGSSISVAGSSSVAGIDATEGGNTNIRASSAGVTVANNAALIVNGASGSGIRAISYYNFATVINTAAVSVTGSDATGIQAYTGVTTTRPTEGDALIVSTAPVTVNAVAGGAGAGLYARNQGPGSARVESSAPVTVTTGSLNGYGIRVESYDGPASALVTAPVTTITAGQNPILLGSAGVDVQSQGLGITDAVTAITTAAVSTTGAGATGVKAESYGGGRVTVTTTAPVMTNGRGAPGIAAHSYRSLSNDVDVTAISVSTAGDLSRGIDAVADVGQVFVKAQMVSTKGLRSHGINTVSSVGNTTIEAGTVVASGQDSSGIRAITLGVADVTVRNSVQGGWGDSYGVMFGNGTVRGTAHLTNFGAIGALSDRAIGSVPVTAVVPVAPAVPPTAGGSGAVTQTPLAPPAVVIVQSGASSQVGGVTVDNNKDITGFVAFADSTSGAVTTFNNLAGGLFDVRNFADINGDGLRDVKAVSISTFGGAGSAFNNNAGALVRLAGIANPPSVDTANYYVPTTGVDSRPLEAGFYDLTRDGVVQGQFVNLQTFTNSGTIDLRGPEIGNTLVMTSNPTAGGTPGTGTFVASGGRLLVNTRLNDGIAPGGASNSYSDMLIVDRTRMGSGPTSIIVSYDASVPGALTPGNGIEIVEVRDKANSAAGVFILGNRVAGSAYEYQLYHNGVGSDAADGNWYLRSTRIIEPGKPVERPNYRVEVPVDIVVPALASRLGMTMLGTLDDRYGPDFAPLSEQPPAPAPAREIWCKDASRNFRCTPTPQQNAYYAGTTTGAEAPLPAGHLFWTRVFGQFGAQNAGGRSELDRFNAFERRGPSYDYRLGGIQFGVHLFRDHLNTFGVSFGYGHIASTVATVYGEGRAGSTSMDAYSLGAYWTHRRPSGWYVDTVLQATHYGAVNATSVLGERLSTKGWGFAASLETGYPIVLGAGWSITPQMQAIYQTLGFDSGADRFGQVRYGDTSTVFGRAGARLARDFAIEDGRKVTAWARVNYWHTFGGNARTTFTNLAGGYPVTLGTGLGGSWMQFGIGASGQLTQSLSLFATADYNLTVANGSGQSYTGRVGLQMRW